MQENTLAVDCGELKSLLIKTKRIAQINGKAIPQVEATTLKWENANLETCNIVRDGITSISYFSCVCAKDSSGEIVVANIDLMLGALSKHKGNVSLTQKDGKVKILSAGKQTTIVSDERAKAFTHTKKTVKEWSSDSAERFGKALNTNEGKYTASTGDVVEPCAEISMVSVSELLDAMDSGSMNGQHLAQYKFYTEEGILWLSVGSEIKGRTKSMIAECEPEFSTVIGGGLENVLRKMQGSINLKFFDLTPLGGGISLLISQGTGIGRTTIFQREVAKPNAD